MQNNQKPVKPYIVIGNRENMTYQQWLDIRKNSIGGSEIAQACGLNRFRAPLALWAEKTGVVKRTVEDNDKMMWGRILEPIVKQHFSKITGYEVKEVPQILALAAYPFLTANLDGICIVDGEPCVLEVKTTSFASDWEEGGCPIEYFLQCQHYMFITGMQKAYLVVLIGGSDFRYIKIDRNDELISAIECKAINFWNNNILKNIPPAPSATDNELMAKIYPSNDSTIVLHNDYAAILEELEGVKQLEADVKKQRDELEAKLKMVLGESKSNNATCGDWKISWKESSRSTFDSSVAKSILTEEQIAKCTKVTTSRTLRISKSKPKTAKKK